MENKTVRCPFCDHETKHGLGVCLPCGASITYGKAPLWFGQIGALLSVVLSFLIVPCLSYIVLYPLFPYVLRYSGIQSDKQVLVSCYFDIET